MVSTAEFVMSDGKSLERVGVMPDERALPTPRDLAMGSDPVLAKALTEAGWEIDADRAGKVFTRKWRELDTD